MTEITDLTLNEIVTNIKKKKISSTEVTKSFVERSEKSKKLNVYITENFSSAIEQAKKFDENPNYKLKLPGIPIAVKDLFCTDGIKTTAGSKILNNFWAGDAKIPTILALASSNDGSVAIIATSFLSKTFPSINPATIFSFS